MELDALDQKAARVYEGFVVRKDLVRRFKGQYPVPTYVAEFLLGRYCASTDENEIKEGLEVVQRQLGARTVRAGEEELFKARAKETGVVRIIDVVTARLDEKSDSYLAHLPSLRLRDVRIDAKQIRDNERLLTGGFFAEVSLSYDAAIAEEQNGRPFGIETITPIQCSSSKDTALKKLADGRREFSTEEWKKLLIRSVGLEPEALSPRAQDLCLLRMTPFIENNYNMIELGPRGTGKSHLFQQISPYSHLVSGGKATVARMFVNNASGQRGLVCQYDVVCFDEVAGISFDQKDGVNIMKGYMESGEFSRGKENIRGFGSIVMVGNFEVDVEHQQRIGHLLGPLPNEMKNDTAFMDRIHSYVPGWDLPKMSKAVLTEHFGLVGDFVSECWNCLRPQSRLNGIHGKVFFGGALSGRDTTAVQKTINGLLKLLYPSPDMIPSDADLEWAVRLALECRRRVKEQQKKIGTSEFRNVHFSYHLGQDGVEQFVVTPEIQSENSIGSDPLPPGQIWSIGPGNEEEGIGLYRVEVNAGPGGGVRILNQPVPPPFKESVRYGEQNLYSRAKELVGDRDPRGHEFSVQLRAFDVARSGSGLGIACLLSFCSALLEKSVRGGLVAVGTLNLGGSVDQVHNAVSIAELAVEKGAAILLMPVSTRKQLVELSDDMATKINILFYTDAREAMLKALME